MGLHTTRVLNVKMFHFCFLGVLTSPNHPGIYDNDLDFWVHVVGPEDTRLVFVFQNIDLEYQKDCLYDFVEVSCYVYYGA